MDDKWLKIAALKDWTLQTGKASAGQHPEVGVRFCSNYNILPKLQLGADKFDNDGSALH